MRGSAQRNALTVVILLFVVLSAVIAIRTPPWESSDEPGHVQNIETLVAGHWYRMGPNTGNEAHQAPLYYILMAGWQRVSGQPARVPAPGDATFANHRSRGLFVHHSAADHRFLLWLRLPNILLGAATILLTALAVRRLTSDPWTPVVAACIVAFEPRFVFLSAFVTNDNLVNLLGAVLTLLAVSFLDRPTMLRIAAVGGTVGLLIATKLSALPVAVVLVVLVLTVRARRDRLRFAVIAGAALFVSAGWYLVQNYARYGDPLARRASLRYLEGNGGVGTFLSRYTVLDPLGLIVHRVPERIFVGFWYTSGWNQFRWPVIVNAPFWIALALGLLGLIGSRVAPRALLTLAALTVGAFASVWITAFQTATYEARLAFVGLPALAALAALGLERWSVASRFVLPAMLFVGLLVAIHNDVFAVNWR